MNEEQQKPEKDKLNGLYQLLIVVLLIWLLSVFVLPCFYPELEDRAKLGDSFGVINSLFSGLAFAGIIYTILLQRKELVLQRDELRDTRLELKRSANAQEKSEKQQRRQSENLKITAKLNALNTLLNYYVDEFPTIPHVNIHDQEKRKNNKEMQSRYIRQIKEILDRKED